MLGSEKCFLAGRAGKLESLWLPRESELLERAVILCPPHPLYGGTMDTKVVARTARELGEAGFQTLRFNYRGVGRSEGSWGEGTGECEDLRAVIDYLKTRLPESRLAAFGFSFGAWVGLEVGSDRDDVEALVGIAPPIDRFSFESFPVSTKPKLLIYAGRDEIVEAQSLREWTSKLLEPKRTVEILEADHLFSAQTEKVAHTVVQFLLETFD